MSSAPSSSLNPSLGSQLQGRTAIITGAAQGMGEAMAKLFAKAGANVVVSDVKEEQGKKVAEEIKEDGGKAIFIACDVTKTEQIKALVDAAVQEYGKLDIAVNNAAFAPDVVPVNELDEDYFDRLISVNYKGVAYGMKWASKQMMKQGNGGAIVNMASVSGIRPQPGSPAYTSAKHAVIGLTKSGAMDLAKYGIRVNAICPGAIDTPFLQGNMEQLGLTEQEFAPRISLLKRFGKPEEIAQAALWLVSDAASYATGTIMTVDAGFTTSM
ncbi:hypothetical protein D9758_012122 [Tetrapyrgos nigripes]|uniref:Uncharacterized protein n=1 Tax=Tetrapyrgos nigripes TaxID=182062 RepID=A0A8H5CLG2_9AGAR|nr:hypothetical protein D9758_012122 [Tetrapyrgos nigripes]